MRATTVLECLYQASCQKSSVTPQQSLFMYNYISYIARAEMGLVYSLESF